MKRIPVRTPLSFVLTRLVLVTAVAVALVATLAGCDEGEVRTAYDSVYRPNDGDKNDAAKAIALVQTQRCAETNEPLLARVKRGVAVCGDRCKPVGWTAELGSPSSAGNPSAATAATREAVFTLMRGKEFIEYRWSVEPDNGVVRALTPDLNGRICDRSVEMVP